MTKIVDRILIMLSSGDYSIEEIASTLKIDSEVALNVITFLMEFDFVRKENSKLRITEKGLRFIKNLK